VRRRLTETDLHLIWLDGRAPSAALVEDYERDFSASPIGRWVERRPKRRRQARPQVKDKR
jgi:hypothetical protein